MNERIQSLDLIRGVAILGILFMNIMAMGTPIEAYYSPEWREGLSALELPLYHLQSLIFESRFMSMFSLLFGVGLYIQYQSAVSKGLDAKARLFSRLRWLLLFGVLHGFFLFLGDILTLYACCGFLLVWLLASSNRKQLGLAILFLFLGQLLMLSLLAAVYFKGMPMMMSELPLSADVLGGLQQTWTTYPSRLLAQAASFGEFLVFIPMAGLWHNTGLMLIGILLYKKGFFHNNKFIPWGLLSLVLGFVLGLLVQQLRAGIGYQSEAGFASMTLMMLAGLLSAIGYCSLLVLAANSSAWIVRMLKNAGKMAFTLYIGQSVLAYLIFVWLVPQYWGQWGRPELLLLVIALTVVQLWFANFWQQRYGQGPLEKGWRHLAYRKFQQPQTTE